MAAARRPDERPLDRWRPYARVRMALARARAQGAPTSEQWIELTDAIADLAQLAVIGAEEPRRG